jgi:hypothetical protein
MSMAEMAYQVGFAHQRACERNHAMSEVPAGWFPHPQREGSEIYWDGAAWTEQTRPAAATSSTATATSAPPTARGPVRLRAAWLAATLTPILVVAAIGGYLILSHHTANAQASLSKALSATLAERSADATVSGSAHIEGVTAPIAGTGAFDFTHNDGTMSLSISVLGQQINEKAIDSGHSTYLNLGPDVSKVLPGKSWISLNFSQLSSQSGTSSQLGSGGVGTSDPGGVLNILGKGGNTVSALGPSTINGVSAQGYSVVVNTRAIHKEIKNLPEWMQQAASSVSNEKARYKVFIGSSGTVYRLTTIVSEQVSGESFDESVSMDFSKFGTAVQVTPPAANQVASYQAFLNAAKALESRTLS